MELVGVRNITCVNNQTLDFEIEEGNILKVLNVSHQGNPASISSFSTKLNNEYIYYTKARDTYGAISFVHTNFPFYLSEGIHELHTGSNYSSTLYCLEFKLTTP